MAPRCPRHVTTAVCGLHFRPGQSLPSEKPFQVTLGLGKRCLLVRGLVMPLEKSPEVAATTLPRKSLDNRHLHTIEATQYIPGNLGSLAFQVT